MLRHKVRAEEGAALDLRAALATLRDCPADAGQFLLKDGFSPDAACTDFAYAHAGVPARPRSGSEPAVIYRQPHGPDLLLGLYGCEHRLKHWMPGLRGRPLPEACATLAPIPPVVAPVQHDSWEGVDLARLPFPRATARDAGPYITMGFVMTGQQGPGLALSAHRMLVLDDRRLAIFMLTSRHLRHRAQAAWSRGEDLPVTINIGVPPAVAVASATATAHLPPGMDKLSLAGALGGAPVALSGGDAPCLAQSEFVLHGRLTPQTCAETLGDRPAGVTMPEFLGYDGHAGPPLQVIEVTAITQRPGAILQATLGPGREQCAILGLGGALAQSLALAARGGLSQIADLRYAMAGGGMLMLYVALRPDAARQLDLARLARRLIEVMPFTKTIVFTDDDVNLACDEDVLWAMTTRCNLAQDTHAIDGLRPLRMDPSQTEDWHAARGGAVPTRAWIDATRPAALRAAATRSFDG
ncbi:UbiD family decarboxylase domain-containing protein [Thalassococcus sp. BH17M4-6]|uniref:UbiD family decarboxylase domain-containing protein n=1 Tax=Thalassococcus sp. BH17M4-6 TaxID=3413148 RepID=UPI003BBF1683